MTSVNHSSKIIVNDIISLINNDDQIKHCRINIVNGCGDIFMKYKRSLSALQDKDHISVRFYPDIESLHKDLFHRPDFMANDWFNLFVFNLNYCRHLCINELCSNYNTYTQSCNQPTYCIDAICSDYNEGMSVREQLMKEIRGIDLISHELRSKFDSKFYASSIVSMLPAKVIHCSFEEFTGTSCPIKCLRYLDFDFDGEELLMYMYKILKTHSKEFLNKWKNALEKLEGFSKTQLFYLQEKGA